MADLAPGFRIFVPGNFEDAFVYMNSLVLMTTERDLVSTNYERLLFSILPDDRRVKELASMFLLRNDYLATEGVEILFRDLGLRKSVLSSMGEASDELLTVVDEWDVSSSYEELLGDSIVLDLQIYAQRLFAATTKGVLQTDLVVDNGEMEFARRTKRTDARCLSIGIRYGTVAASCGDDGLLVSYDEFGQLDIEENLFSQGPSASSIRTSWLGYNLINYTGAASAEALHADYAYTRDRGRRSEAIVTGLNPDDQLIASEAGTWENADFVFNNHSTFFVHFESGSYEIHRRSWSRGKLGAVASTSHGELPRPLSAHAIRTGMVVETYDSVNLVNEDGVTRLHEGEAITVRSFPHSKWYQNLALIVSEDGLHIVSPFPAIGNGNGHRTRE